MRLHQDWKRIVKKAWSFRLLLIAGLLSGCEVVLPYYSDSFPRSMFAILSIVVTLLATIARVTSQNGFNDDKHD